MSRIRPYLRRMLIGIWNRISDGSCNFPVISANLAGVVSRGK